MSVSRESLKACREVSVSLGDLEACKRASVSLVSLFEVSHYARFARALAATTFRHRGPCGTNLGPILDSFGTTLESGRELSTRGVHRKPNTCSSMTGKRD